MKRSTPLLCEDDAVVADTGGGQAEGASAREW